MNSQYATSPQNFSKNVRYAQSRQSSSPLRSMQIEYAKALDQIEDLKLEKDSLRNALDEALRDKSDQDYREHSLYIERASQNLQESYTHKMYVQSEHRVLALEEENSQLRKQIDSQTSNLAQLQTELRASQNKIQELNHIETYNHHLQAEVQYLDQEFQNITKKVEWLDEDKAKTQINKSVSTKYSQNYNQTLLKYINHLVKVIESLESKNPIRCRFNELFSKNSSIFKLVGNSDYTSLLLKAFKFIAELMPSIAPNLPLADFSLASTTRDMSPNKSRNLSASNFNFRGILGDISPIAIPNPVLQAKSPTSSRTPKNNESATPTRVKSSTLLHSASLTERAKQPLVNANSKGERNLSGSGQQLKSNQSASFGGRDNTSRDSQSFSAAVAVQNKSINTQATPQTAWETTPKERTVPTETSRREYESKNKHHHRNEYERQNTAELELIQRDRELLEKERQLIEKKRLLMQRARELEDEEESIRGQQSIIEKERKSTSDFPLNVDNNNSMQKFRREQQSQSKPREDDLQSAKSLKPILKGQVSQAFTDANRDESILNNSSASMKGKSAKDISAVLREKSKHLAQVLTRMGSYNSEASPFNNQPEQERTLQSGHSPVNSLPIYNRDCDNSYEQEDEGPEMYDARDAAEGNISYRSGINPHSVSPFDTGRGGSKGMRRDDVLQKRVSFDERQVTEGFEDYQQEQEEAPQEYMYHGAFQNSYPEHEEGYSIRQSRSPSRGNLVEPPRGKQFSTFTVSFGRTESVERRSTSPPMRDIAGILDTPSKKRVHHTSQTYNVVTGDDVKTIALPDTQRLHYKLAYESAPYHKSNSKQSSIKKNIPSSGKHVGKSSAASISSKSSL